jgi:predicted AAA+ superfamily ATPase
MGRMRYFYEKYPELHLIAAGSLLEFAIEELASFAVGRIRSVYLYPFSFDEFLRACGEGMLADACKQAAPEKPLSGLAHSDLCKLLKKFLVTGGMPEAVATQIKTGDFLKSQMVIDDLMTTFKNDFAKYKKRMPSVHIENVFESVANQIDGKFVYGRVEGVNSAQVRQSLELLIKAGLVIPVTHSSANGVPLGAGANFKRRRMLPLDTGMFLRMLGFDVSQIMLADDFKTINMGALAEMFVGLEILKASPCYTPHQLFYWHREKKQSNAQVDYVIQRNGRVIPIEVKSGTKGAMPSLRIFMQEKGSGRGIRASMENLGRIEDVDIYPMYAISNVIDN